MSDEPAMIGEPNTRRWPSWLLQAIEIESRRETLSKSAWLRQAALERLQRRGLKVDIPA